MLEALIDRCQLANGVAIFLETGLTRREKGARRDVADRLGEERVVSNLVRHCHFIIREQAIRGVAIRLVWQGDEPPIQLEGRC